MGHIILLNNGKVPGQKSSPMSMTQYKASHLVESNTQKTVKTNCLPDSAPPSLAHS